MNKYTKPAIKKGKLNSEFTPDLVADFLELYSELSENIFWADSLLEKCKGEA